MSSGYSVSGSDGDTWFKAWSSGAPKIGFATNYKVSGQDLQDRYEAARTHVEYPVGDLRPGYEVGNDGGGEGWPYYMGSFGDVNENDSRSLGYWFRWIDFVPISLSITGSVNATWNGSTWTAAIGGYYPATNGTKVGPSYTQTNASYAWTLLYEENTGGSSYLDDYASGSSNWFLDDVFGTASGYSQWRLTATDNMTGETAYSDVTVYFG